MKFKTGDKVIRNDFISDINGYDKASQRLTKGKVYIIDRDRDNCPKEYNKEVISLQINGEDITMDNDRYFEDSFDLYRETQDNKFVKMMCSNERMLDI